jgi:hypothetical protein
MMSSSSTAGVLFKIALPLMLVLLLAAPREARAQSTIKQPGNHPHYGVELEPHLALQWTNRWGGDDGIGPGMRVNIPFIHNGPIRQINNNMGITFGLDITFGDAGGPCWAGMPDPGHDCNVTEFWLPVAMQWNFWLTDVISVFGEPGFAIAHRRWDFDYYCNGPGNPICDGDDTETDVEFVFWGGGRFMFSDRIGATVRIGYPMITAGINFLL